MREINRAFARIHSAEKGSEVQLMKQCLHKGDEVALPSFYKQKSFTYHSLFDHSVLYAITMKNNETLWMRVYFMWFSEGKS